MNVRHFNNPSLVLEVTDSFRPTYGGYIPTVATDGKGGWYAGEVDLSDGSDEPYLWAVNGYGDQSTARSYARSLEALDDKGTNPTDIAGRSVR